MTDEQVDLLRGVLQNITAHPQEWEQGHYAVKTPCGAAYCVAGHVVVAKGHQIDWTLRRTATRIVDTRDLYALSPTIHSVARESLGLDCDDADLLFRADNTLSDLWRIAEQLSDGRIVAPAEVQA